MYLPRLLVAALKISSYVSQYSQYSLKKVIYSAIVAVI